MIFKGQAKLFTIARKKPPRRQSPEKRIKKRRCIYKMKFHSGIKKNEVIIAGGKNGIRIVLVVLRELSQIRKDKYYVILP